MGYEGPARCFLVYVCLELCQVLVTAFGTHWETKGKSSAGEKTKGKKTKHLPK